MITGDPRCANRSGWLENALKVAVRAGDLHLLARGPGIPGFRRQGQGQDGDRGEGQEGPRHGTGSIACGDRAEPVAEHRCLAGTADDRGMARRRRKGPVRADLRRPIAGTDGLPDPGAD